MPECLKPSETPHLLKLPFVVSSEGHHLKGDQLLSQSISPVLFLHGAGQSTRHLFDPIRHELAMQNMASIAFDFIGHGETGGCLHSSSLHQRFQQACDVIETLAVSQSLSLVASSMSGYTAIKLTEKYEIQHLILIVPAVYHPDAYFVPFNQGFSTIIRKAQSWRYSDAWSIMQQFKGDLLIIAAERDEVVPNEIIHQLYASASSAKSRKCHFVANSPHKILAFLAEHSSELQMINYLITNVLKN